MFFCWATILIPNTIGIMMIRPNLIKRDIVVFRCSIIIVKRPKKIAKMEYRLNKFGKENKTFIKIRNGIT